MIRNQFFISFLWGFFPPFLKGQNRLPSLFHKVELTCHSYSLLVFFVVLRYIYSCSFKAHTHKKKILLSRAASNNCPKLSVHNFLWSRHRWKHCPVSKWGYKFLALKISLFCDWVITLNTKDWRNEKLAFGQGVTIVLRDKSVIVV